MTELDRDLIESRGGGPLRNAPAGWESALELAGRAPASASAPWPVSRNCSTEYRARRTSGTRSLRSIRLLVVHCTEGDTAAGAAAWFANPSSEGSAHVVVDSFTCYRTLPPSAIAWGAPGVNLKGWHLELAGHARWTRTDWLRHRGTIDRAAYKLALHAQAFGGIPLRHLTDGQLRAGERGIVSHRQVSHVYGGDHSDPGASFPWDTLLESAHRYHAEMFA